MKRTKILCTIGPASWDYDTLDRMVKEGMDAARLNFSHGTYATHKKIISAIRKVSEKHAANIAIVQDLQGPRIRLGKLPQEGVEVKKGESIILTTDKRYEDNYKDKKFFVTYENLHKDIQEGEMILISDGLIEVKVKQIEKKDIKGKVIIGGLLESNKGINLPETDLSISPITEKDKEDLEFGVKQNIDWVALSFVGHAKDILDLKYLIKKIEKENKIKPANPIKIIAKIEKADALRHIDDILEVVDGIMIARGDLGLEIPAQDVPLAQKTIIDKCLERSKPVIVATQMLDSMMRNQRPTRAEVSDVANAVIDHTDVVMLSGETASGKYPVESVQMMSSIIRKTENSVYDDMKTEVYIKKKIETIDEAVSRISNIMAQTTQIRIILVTTMSGHTARTISRYRPEIPIYASTHDDRVQRQLSLSWGVKSFILPRCESIEELFDRAIFYLKKNKIVKVNDKILILAGEPVGVKGNVNMIEIKLIK